MRWILNNGALAHTDGDATLLNEVTNIPLVTIRLPNGTYTLASEQGPVALGKGLNMRNVLYVLKLNCNLVSTSKSCKQLNCSVTHFDDFCMI